MEIENDIYVYKVMGSSGEYTVVITLEPLTVSCTCMAAITGLPCKHRLKILDGLNPDFIEPQGNYISVLQKVARRAKKSGVFELLEAYEIAKKEKLELERKSDSAFKKYRSASLDLLTGKVKNDKAMQKAATMMGDAIGDIVPAEIKIKGILAEIGKILIRPGHTETVTLAAEAAEEPS